MEFKIGEMYKSSINNRLFEIIDIKKENGRDYVAVKNVDPKSNEFIEIATDIETFRRLQLTKYSK